MAKRLPLILASALVITIPLLAIGRLFFGIPFLPLSGREVVARLSGLPIPFFATALSAADECAGLLCMDYYGYGFVQLEPAACAKAINAAHAAGWRSLPLPITLQLPISEYDTPQVPSVGYFRYTQFSESHYSFTWLNTQTCQVFAELSLS
jgi:hypothetical protein